ncbi:CPBP family intramembrane metalloprotease [Candidatus Woesearchaeota archaeon]|nr:CPBP family intramembrane metalloprotease [Candidatus Woesearchaeota archaeon]
MQRHSDIASVILICAASFSLIAMQNHAGWIALAAAFLFAFIARHTRYILLIIGLITLLAFTEISTSVTLQHMFEMSWKLGLAILLPYLITKKIWKDNVIEYSWHHGRAWYKKEVSYILITAIIAYFLLPFYLVNSGAINNWPVAESDLFRLFIGTNALGFWDELFFINTLFPLFMRMMPMRFANLAQAIIFTSFLYELGFTGWGPLFIFPFALIQGYIYYKTKSLLYVITIHLTLDLVLYLALVNTAYPLGIFIT